MDQTVTTNSTAENMESTGHQIGKLFPWVASGALVALGATNIALFNKVGALEGQIAKSQAASQAEIASLREASESTVASVQQNIAQLSTHVDEGTKKAQANAQAVAQRLAANAQKHADQLATQLAEQQKATAAEMSKAIGEVKSVTDTHTAQVTGLESNITGVKAEVVQAKSTIDQTIADLHSVRGDLGVQSGLIATNAKELAALRELGDRQYYEFTIRKGAGPAKMANMTVELKKSDVKRNKYNIQIVADDKRVEKKDRTVNEPVQMYVGGMRQPYEIVVNQVQKDTIVGYLAVPKVLQSRR